jgi:hypothetical protein
MSNPLEPISASTNHSASPDYPVIIAWLCRLSRAQVNLALSSTRGKLERDGGNERVFILVIRKRVWNLVDEHAIMSGYAPVVKLVDTPDLKSVACKGVPVRFRPGAPVSRRVSADFTSSGRIAKFPQYPPSSAIGASDFRLLPSRALHSSC